MSSFNSKKIDYIPSYVLWMFLCNAFYLFITTLDYKMEMVHYSVLVLMLYHYISDAYAQKKGFDKDLIYIGILIPLYVITKCGFDTVFVVLSFIILKNYPLNKIVISSIIVLVLTIILYIVLYLLGFIIDVTIYKGEGVIHKLGFSNANIGAHYIFQLIMMISIYFYGVKNNIKLILCFVFLASLAYYISIITGNRTYFYALCVYFVLQFFSKKFKQLTFKKALLVLPFFFYVLSFCLPIINNEFFIDDFLSGRVYILSLYLAEMDFNNILLGRDLIENLPFDNAYFMLLFNGGITSVYFFLTKYVRGIKNSSTEYLNLFMPFLVTILCTGFTESTFSGLTTTTVLFFRILYEPTLEKYERYYVPIERHHSLS